MNKSRRRITALGIAAFACAAPSARAQSPADRHAVAQAAQTASDAIAFGRKVDDLKAAPNKMAVQTGERAVGAAANTAGSLVGKGMGQLFGSRFGRFFGRGTRSLIKTGGHIAGAAMRGASSLSGDLSHKLTDEGTHAVVQSARNYARGAENQMRRETQDQFLTRTLGGAAPLAHQGLAQMAQGTALDLKAPTGWAALLATAAKANPALLQDLLSQQSAGGGASRTNMLALIANAVRGDASLAQALIHRSQDPNADTHTNELVQAAFADNLPLVENLLFSGGDVTSTLAVQALASVLQQILPPGPAQNLAAVVSGGLGETATEIVPVVKEGVRSLAGLLSGD